MRQVFEALLSWSWERLPRLVARLTVRGAQVLVDGAYLCAAPIVAALAPIGAWVGGATLGLLSFDHTSGNDPFSASMILICTALLFGSAGSALGCRFVLGYAICHGLRHFRGGTGWQGDLLETIASVGGSLLLSYFLLSILCVFIPSIVTSMRANVSRLWLVWLPGPLRPPVAVCIHGVLQAGAVFAWAHAVPTLIRPVYTWQNSLPAVEAMEPLQEHSTILVILAAIFGSLRAMFDHIALKSPDLRARIRPLLRDILLSARYKVPHWIALPLRSLAIVFLLSGTVTAPGDAIVLWCLLIVFFLVRQMAGRRFAKLGAHLRKMPVAARLLFGAFLSYLLGLCIIGLMWDHVNTFRPVMWSVAISTLIFAFLLPPRPVGAAKKGKTP